MRSCNMQAQNSRSLRLASAFGTRLVHRSWLGSCMHMEEHCRPSNAWPCCDEIAHRRIGTPGAVCQKHKQTSPSKSAARTEQHRTIVPRLVRFSVSGKSLNSFLLRNCPKALSKYILNTHRQRSAGLARMLGNATTVFVEQLTLCMIAWGRQSHRSQEPLARLGAATVVGSGRAQQEQAARGSATAHQSVQAKGEARAKEDNGSRRRAKERGSIGFEVGCPRSPARSTQNPMTG